MRRAPVPSTRTVKIDGAPWLLVANTASVLPSCDQAISAALPASAPARATATGAQPCAASAITSPVPGAARDTGPIQATYCPSDERATSSNGCAVRGDCPPSEAANEMVGTTQAASKVRIIEASRERESDRLSNQTDRPRFARQAARQLTGPGTGPARLVHPPSVEP